MANIYEIFFSLFPHPSDTLDSLSKSEICETNDDRKATVNTYFDDLDRSIFYYCIQTLNHRLSKCMEVEK